MAIELVSGPRCDENHVLVWYLKDRKVERAQVFFGAEMVRHHRDFFDALYTKAQELHREELLLLPLREKDRERVSAWPHLRTPVAWNSLGKGQKPEAGRGPAAENGLCRRAPGVAGGRVWHLMSR